MLEEKAKKLQKRKQLADEKRENDKVFRKIHDFFLSDLITAILLFLYIFLEKNYGAFIEKIRKQKCQNWSKTTWFQKISPTCYLYEQY